GSSPGRRVLGVAVRSARSSVRAMRRGWRAAPSSSPGSPCPCPSGRPSHGRTSAMTWRIGVDIGGTFNDVVLADETTGAVDVIKVPTTPRDFADGVVAGLRTATTAHRVAAGDVGWLAHATTVVTNALLQGRGARGA